MKESGINLGPIYNQEEDTIKDRLGRNDLVMYWYKLEDENGEELVYINHEAYPPNEPVTFERVAPKGKRPYAVFVQLAE